LQFGLGGGAGTDQQQGEQSSHAAVEA